MKKNEVLKKALNQELNSLIITCKKGQKSGINGTDICLKMLFKKDSKNLLSIDEKKNLMNLFFTSSYNFTNELINLHLGQQLINDVKEGTSYLLPKRYQRFYNKCVRFSTGNFNIYFTDQAINKFKTNIFYLSERSKKDCLKFAKAKLQFKEAQHLGIYLSKELSFCHGRNVSFNADDEYVLGPKNAVYYEVDLKEDGTIDIEDINNILELIEIFKNIYGNFEYIKYNKEECLAYNQGSLKVTGIDLEPKIFEKVLSCRN